MNPHISLFLAHSDVNPINKYATPRQFNWRQIPFWTDMHSSSVKSKRMMPHRIGRSTRGASYFFLEANSVRDAKMKRAVLLSTVGSTAFSRQKSERADSHHWRRGHLRHARRSAPFKHASVLQSVARRRKSFQTGIVVVFTAQLEAFWSRNWWVLRAPKSKNISAILKASDQTKLKSLESWLCTAQYYQ